MTDLPNAWSRLKTAGHRAGDYVRLRLSAVSACPTYAAKRVSDGSSALILEVDTRALSGLSELPASKGLELSTSAISPGPSGKTRLILSLAEPKFLDVFSALADDIVHTLRGATSDAEAVATLVDRLRTWQEFLRRFGAQGMSPEARRGLFGELVFLRDCLLTVLPGTEALKAWTGPRRAPHDFQTPHGSVEVKTTSAASPHSFRVANIRQLDDRSVSALFICVVTVDESEGGQETLPEAIDRLRSALGASGGGLDEPLIRAGYIEAQRLLYKSPRYSIRSLRFFRVGEGFPRLLESKIPNGVEGVSFSVALAGCAGFSCSDLDVLEALSPESCDAD
ncbi:MAG: PD-(D/E)XK motif protein [Chloroflexota bacterium]|nr:PD-(D/E)XK motif protein [Chloroflexota bacterium]